MVPAAFSASHFVVNRGRYSLSATALKPTGHATQHAAALRRLQRECGPSPYVFPGRQLLEAIARAESARTEKALGLLQYSAQYIEKHAPIFDKHEREGLAPPDIYPHPDDFVVNEATGEVTIDGPTTKEAAGARKVVRQHAIESMLRYFEVEAALAKKPTNRALRREFKELKKYQDFFEKDAQRNARHEALRQALAEHQVHIYIKGGD